jgi:exopolysaccharide biosynthesis operon protein EpsL
MTFGYGAVIAAEVAPNAGDTIRFSVGAGLVHDDNLFRTTSNEHSDTIRRLSAGVNINVPVSLQQFFLAAGIDDNRYQNFSRLDYVRSAADGGWNWQVADRASGKLAYHYQRRIIEFGDLQSQTRDLITQKGPLADANFLLTPEWELVGSASRIDSRHSDPGRSEIDHQIDTGAVGVNYLTGSKNSVGLLVKRISADYPNRQSVGLPGGGVALVDNSFDETQTSAVTTWSFSGVSTIKARAGYTKRKHQDLTGRDFSGATGELDYHWVPTGVTSLDVSLYRNIRSSPDLSASYILFRGFSVAPTWNPLAALTLRLRGIREQRDYNGDPGLVLGTEQRRADRFQSAQLSAAYAATRSIEVSAALETGKRTSNTAGFDYKYNVASAAIKASF